MKEAYKILQTRVVKVAGVGEAHMGDVVVWTITVTNNGPDGAVDVVVRDVVPSQLVDVSVVSVDQGVFANGVWTIGNLINGESVSLVLSTKVDASNVNITNVAVVNSTTYDPNETNNEDNDTVVIPPEADLSVVKVAGVGEAHMGDVVVWTITVVNNGPNTALNCIVNEILHSGLIYVRGSASKGSYDLSSGIWAIGNLTNGETATLTITTTAQNPGLIENLVNVSSDTYDPDMANNEYAANVTVNNNETIPENNETIPENNETIPNDNVTVPDDVVITPSGDVSIPSDGVVKSIDSKATGNPVFILLLMLFSLVFVSSRKFK